MVDWLSGSVTFSNGFVIFLCMNALIVTVIPLFSVLVRKKLS